MNPSTHPGVAEPRALKVIGRPAFHATLEDRTRVARMCRLGIHQSQIAIVFGIALRTLRRHFRLEIKAAREARPKPAPSLYKMATSGKNTAATIFWAKTRCKFRYGGPPPGDFELDESQSEAISGDSHVDEHNGKNPLVSAREIGVSDAFHHLY